MGETLLPLGFQVLTAAEWPHLCVLRVHLRDVRNPLAEHVHGDFIAILVLPVSSLIACSLYLGPAVSWQWKEQATRQINAT